MAQYRGDAIRQEQGLVFTGHFGDVFHVGKRGGRGLTVYDNDGIDSWVRVQSPLNIVSLGTEASIQIERVAQAPGVSSFLRFPDSPATQGRQRLMCLRTTFGPSGLYPSWISFPGTAAVPRARTDRCPR